MKHGIIKFLTTFALFSAVAPAVDAAQRIRIDYTAPGAKNAAGAASVATAAEPGVLRKTCIPAGRAPKPAARLETGDDLTLGLFDGAEFDVKLGERTPTTLGGRAFLASSDGYDGVKNVVVVQTDDGLQVNVNDFANARVYTVYSTAGGTTVKEIEPTKEPRSDGGLAVRSVPTDAVAKTPRFAGSSGAGSAVSDEDGNVCVDVLVVFEKLASEWAKDNGGVTNFAEVAVQKMNTVMANTGLNNCFRFRLIGVREIKGQALKDADVPSKTGAELQGVLNSIVNGEEYNGYGWSEVADLRDETGADLACVMLDTGYSWGVVGYGWSLQEDYNMEFQMPSLGFNCCAIRAVAEDHTMTHEVGHNIGAGHAREQTTQPGPQHYSYSSGHYFKAGEGKTTNAYHTIMAYDDDGKGNRYLEAPYFSSALHYFKGAAVGDAKHDNTRSIKQDFLRVSRYNGWTVDQPEIGEAIGAGQYVWETDGNYPWVVETNDFTTGKSAARSGNIFSYSAPWLRTTVIGPATLTFDYRMRTYKGTFSVVCDSAVLYEYSGAKTDSEPWKSVSVNVPSGSHVVKFVFKQMEYYYAGNNGVTIDNVVFTGGNPPSGAYTVAFEPNGGSPAPAAVARNYGAKLGELPSGLEREGYAFLGWFTSGGTEVTADTAVAADVKLYARWQARGKTVSFDPCGGSVTPEDYVRFDGEPFGPLPSPGTLYGYDFAGWYTDATGGTEVAPTDEVVADTVLYARWQLKEYTVSFKPNGGEPQPESFKRKHGEAFGTLPSGLKRTGYEFAGWRISSSARTNVLETSAVTSDTVLYAFWTANQYTVSCYANGGTFSGSATPELSVLTREYSRQIGTFPTPKLTGHSVEGWYTDAVGGDAVPKTTQVTSNMTVYAHWKLNEFTVKFNVNGGDSASTPASIQRKYGETLGTLPADVTHPGGAFDGWYTAASGGTEVTSETVVTAGVTLYAHWKLNEYTVKFDANGGEPTPDPVVRSHGKSIGALPTANNVKYTGHNLAGWYTARDGGIQVTTSTAITSNQTLYAHWNLNQYTIKFDANGGSPTPDSFKRYHGEQLGTLLGTVTHPGGSFKGWFTARTGGEMVTFATIVTSSMTLYAQWNLRECSVIFDANGGSPELTAITRTYGETIGTLPTSGKVSLEGYTLLGWFMAPVGGTKVTAAMPITSNTTVYAQWQLNEYDVKFAVNGGTPVPASFRKKHGETLGKLPTADEIAREGYDFFGWYVDSKLTTRAEASMIVTSALTLYARWIPTGTVYTVTFDPYGGTVDPESVTRKPDEKLGELPTDVKRIGYTFDGWYTKASGGIAVTPDDVIAADVTVYAHWKIESYTVTYDACGGTPDPAPVTREYNKPVGTLPSVKRTGYSFQGWFTEETAGDKVSSSMLVTSNTTLYAQWKINEYVVTFNSNGGTPTPDSRDRNHGDTVGELPSGVTRYGYSFDGWFTTSSGGTKVTEATVVTGNVTYYAHWSVIVCTITYDANGGEPTPAAFTKNMGKALGTLAGNVKREGHAFVGWFTDPEAGEEVTATSIAESDLTIYAHWRRNEYTVAFDACGGSPEPESVEREHGEELGELPSGVTFAGHVFDGWFTAAEGGDRVAADTIVTNDVTFFAHWIEGESGFRVAFDANGGSPTPASVLRESGEEIGELPTDVGLAGHKLVGWFTAAEGGEEVTAATQVTAEMILFARWELNEYTVSFNADGGEPEPESVTRKHGETLGELPDGLTKTGYTLDGWRNGSVAVSADTVVVADMELIARWTANKYTVTFDANDGTPTPPAVTRNYGATMGSLPTGVTREGYVFQGWYTDKTDGTKITSLTKVTGDVTVYAHWKLLVYTVTFKPSGGDSTPDPISKKPGEKLGELPSDVKRTGYAFDGWFTSSSGGTELTSDTVLTGDVTAYAHWTIESYTVTFDACGGTPVPEPVSRNYKATLGTLPSGPEREGHAFQGWYTGETDGVKVTTSMVVTSNTTLYARWKINEYVVTLNGNGGTAVTKSVSRKHGEQLGALPEDATYKGYLFDGWFDVKSGGVRVSPTNVVTAAVTLYAHWIEAGDGFRVSFDVNGGSPTPASLLRGEGEPLGELPSGVELPGFVLTGWFTSPTGGDKVTPESTVSADTVLYARWEVPRYTVKFDTDGGAPVPDPITRDNGSELGTLPTDVTLACYSLDGWYTSATGGSKVSATTKVTTDVTLYARWTPVSSGTLEQALGVDGVGGVEVSSGGDAGWFGQSQTTYGDGKIAARSGKVAAGQKSSMTMKVSTNVALEVVFRWKCSCASGRDSLEFSIDDVLQKTIDGVDGEWITETNLVAAGTHVLKWTYSRGNGPSVGEDCGWVDAPALEVTSSYLVRFLDDSEPGEQLLPEMKCDAGTVGKLPSAAPSASGRLVGWKGSNLRRYDPGMLFFDLAKPGETVEMTAIWEE